MKELKVIKIFNYINMLLNIDLIYIVKTLQRSLDDLELLEKKINKTPKKNRHVRKKKYRRRTRKKKSK